MPNIEVKNEDLVFDDSQKVNSRGETILGTFEGPCADIIDGTRNGRHYSEALWKKVFNDPIVKELFECGGILGELDHPADREETKTSEVAICMSEPPKKGRDGLLYGKWDILDTPNGRIAATLAKYGYKFGISSRGSGDTYTDSNGNEEVDPDSYDFQAFDLVILPAVKKARLTFKEGLERIPLGKALTESLNKATPDEKRIMENTLKRLKINLNEDSHNSERSSQVVNIYEDRHPESVDNNEESILAELQESLKSNQTLQNRIVKLQEKLSACYTRESAQEELLKKYKNTIVTLTPSVAKAKALEEKLVKVTKKLSNADKVISEHNESIQNLSEKLQVSSKDKRALKRSMEESLDRTEDKYNALKERYNRVVSEKTDKINTLSENVRRLSENISALEKSSKQKQLQYSSKLDKANKLVEKYKNIATKAVDKYIESEAIKLGVSANEIKNKLPESYTFDDINSICEDLQQYKLNMSKLPFRTLKENTQLKISSPKQVIPIPAGNVDDEIDDSLLILAGLK